MKAGCCYNEEEFQGEWTALEFTVPQAEVADRAEEVQGPSASLSSILAAAVQDPPFNYY